MLENLYTTKMSTDAKRLQNRFSKIRSKSGRFSKLTALIIFAVILLVMACATILIAARVNQDKNGEDRAYAMTQEAFSEYINRPIGAVMADIDYADENKLVFHYGDGFFVINPENGEIRFMLSLPKFNVSQNQQGSNVLDVRVDQKGKYAFLSSVGPSDEIKDFEEYIINLDTGEVQKGAMPADTALFTGIAPTVGTVQNPIGWVSNQCIINGDWTYFLTTQTGTVNGIRLASVNRKENKTDLQYVFNYSYAAEMQEIKKYYAPSDIKLIQDVVLMAGDKPYPLLDRTKLAEIEKTFAAATKIRGGTGCSFTAELVFTRKDGEMGKVTLATDSCAVFKSGEEYFDYSEGDNATLLGYFGLDAETLLDLTFFNHNE